MLGGFFYAEKIFYKNTNFLLTLYELYGKVSATVNHINPTYKVWKCILTKGGSFNETF